MIRTKDLTKKFGGYVAVDNLNLNIKPGETYGFLGPNGAGKTTTISMILGTLTPTEGEIFLFGEKYTLNKAGLRKRIGVVPDKHPVGVWTWMTAFEYLNFFASIFEVKDAGKRIEFLLEQVGLHEFRNRRFTSYSRGMLQKLSIIRALLPNPDILIMDEPITGLDPFGIKQVRDLIVAENREGRSILISSHQLSEIEKICHRVAIIFRGKLLAEDNMDRILKTLVRHREIEIDVEKIPKTLIRQIEKMKFVNKVKVEDLTLKIEINDDTDRRRDVAEFIFKKGLIPLRIQEKNPSLEEAFMTITNENMALFTRKGAQK
ncbi:MAG: ABC transporter ATP-binding protein [Spirochaetales bacterium]|nr:ABC transporter ATP-binding protein [Spirochaetales bacterium]